LLDNAIAATPRGGRIVVDIGKTRGASKIVIADNGKGMSQHELARALEGIRMSADGKGIERRQGLGIPLARQLIEAHGGSLEIQTRRNAGTTAIINLP
jgi:signal transduction histidine kinase